jgi:hypothetical protein
MNAWARLPAEAYVLLVVCWSRRSWSSSIHLDTTWDLSDLGLQSNILPCGFEVSLGHCAFHSSGPFPARPAGLPE